MTPQKQVVINVEDAAALRRIFQFTRTNHKKLPVVNINFELRTTFQTRTLETLSRHPANTRGIATALYGVKTRADVAKAGAVLRRLRRKNLVRRDKRGVWSLR